jgi:hypothetical protein
MKNLFYCSGDDMGSKQPNRLALKIIEDLRQAEKEGDFPRQKEYKVARDMVEEVATALQGYVGLQSKVFTQTYLDYHNKKEDIHLKITRENDINGTKTLLTVHLDTIKGFPAKVIVIKLSSNHVETCTTRLDLSLALSKAVMSSEVTQILSYYKETTSNDSTSTD